MQGRGEMFFSHFEYYFRSYDEVVKSELGEINIQVLSFPKVFKDVVVYASLGVSNFQSQVELYTATDCYFDYVRDIFSSVLLYCIDQDIILQRGLCLDSLSSLSNEFTSLTNKSAVYVTLPHLLPDKFSILEDGSSMILQMIFLSQVEFEYVKANGYDAFEDLLADSEVDVFDIRRPSII